VLDDGAEFRMEEHEHVDKGEMGNFVETKNAINELCSPNPGR